MQQPERVRCWHLKTEDCSVSPTSHGDTSKNINDCEGQSKRLFLFSVPNVLVLQFLMGRVCICHSPFQPCYENTANPRKQDYQCLASKHLAGGVICPLASPTSGVSPWLSTFGMLLGWWALSHRGHRFKETRRIAVSSGSERPLSTSTEQCSPEALPSASRQENASVYCLPPPVFAGTPGMSER